MSWLEKQKAEVEKEKAEKAADALASQKQWESRNRYLQDLAKREQKTKFGDIEGKMCYLDYNEIGAFRSVVEDRIITFFAGDTKLGEIRFWMSESTDYDSDGCGWGSGKFYDSNSMTFYLPYTNRDGIKIETRVLSDKTKVSYEGSMLDKHLADYLLSLLKLQ